MIDEVNILMFFLFIKVVTGKEIGGSVDDTFYRSRQLRKLSHFGRATLGVH